MQDIQPLLASLGRVERLLALVAFNGTNGTKRERVLRLADTGLSQREIAVLAGTTPGVVRNYLRRARRNRRLCPPHRGNSARGRTSVRSSDTPARA